MPALVHANDEQAAAFGSDMCLDTAARNVSRLLVARAERNDYGLSGPVSGTNHEMLARIQAFRLSQYEKRRPYLYVAEQQEIEARLELDARSHHFVAVRGDVIVGSVRLTPAPFEFEALAPSLAASGPTLSRHAELSRLTVAASASRNSVTSSLVVAACHWARASDFEGVVALCRRASRIIFERYGLRATSPVPHLVPWRGPQPYSLLAAGWPELIHQTMRLYGKPDDAHTIDGQQGDAA